MPIIFIILILGIKFSNGIRTKNEIIMDYINDNYDIENLESFYDYINTRQDKTIKYIDDSTNFLQQLLKRYVYLDISLNSQGSDYPMSTNLINIHWAGSKNFYEIYKYYKEFINSVKDGHLKLTLNDKYDENKYVIESNAISPIKIHISKEGEEVKYFAIPSEYISIFPDEIKDKIEQNKNRPIYSINNKSPKEYIYDFNDVYSNLRSKQAKFVQNQYLIKSVFFNKFPFSKEHLQNIQLTYSGTYETITYDYLLLRPKNVFRNSLFNELKSNYYKKKD